MEKSEITILIISFFSTFLIFLHNYVRLRHKKKLRDGFYNLQKSQKTLAQILEEKLKFSKHIKQLINHSGFKINLTQILAISLLFAFAGGLIGFFMTEYWVMGIIMGTAASTIPFAFLLNKEKKRAREIAMEFAPMLKHMANYLRAGNNLRISIEKTAIVTEGALGEVLDEVVKSVNGGEPIIKAVNSVYDEVPLVEFKMFNILVSIHYDMGGDLAASLDNLANVIDEKKVLRNEINGITQETKASAYITAIIPTILFLAMRYISPDYIKQLDKLPYGKIGLVGSFCFIILGLFVVRKLSNIKVDKAYM